METKKTWGFISLLLGGVSLLWGGISISGLLGQTQVLTEMGGFIAAGGSEFLHSYHPEHALAEVKTKYQLIVATGLVLSVIGTLLMRGQWQDRW